MQPLARPDSRVMAMIGTGTQAAFQALAFRAVLGISDLRVFDVDPAAVEAFWTSHGWRRTPITSAWRFRHREDLEAVVRIELPPEAAGRAIAEHVGLEVDYAVNLWSKDF